jgi:hypothetical protein
MKYFVLQHNVEQWGAFFITTSLEYFLHGLSYLCQHKITSHNNQNRGGVGKHLMIKLPDHGIYVEILSFGL